MKNKIDIVDLEIVKHLSSNAKISYTDLASRILVSPSTVHVRVKRLEDLGIIKKTLPFELITPSWASVLPHIWVFF